MRDSTYRLHYQNETLRHSFGGVGSSHPIVQANNNANSNMACMSIQGQQGQYINGNGHNGHNGNQQGGNSISHSHVEAAVKASKEVWVCEYVNI